jgi:hypothetical protein
LRYTTEREDAGSAILDMYAILDESLEDKDYGVGTGKNSCEEAWNQALQFCDYYNTIVTTRRSGRWRACTNTHEKTKELLTT